MTQAQAVRETLRKLGGVATLKDIYKHIHEIDDCKWNTKTPDATIRRIVQQDSEILRLKAGYYMLVEFRDKMMREQMGDLLPIQTLVKRLVEIPSYDTRYLLYAHLNTFFQGTIWDEYSQSIYEIIKQNTPVNHVEMHFHGPVGQAIAHVDTLNTDKTK